VKAIKGLGKEERGVITSVFVFLWVLVCVCVTLCCLSNIYVER